VAPSGSIAAQTAGVLPEICGRKGSGGDDGEGVAILDIDPVVVDRPGTVALPQQPVVEHLPAIDLVGVEMGDGADLGDGVDQRVEGGWHERWLPGDGEHLRSLRRVGQGGEESVGGGRLVPTSSARP
jgi:hypothetical protein